jgi:hypothetical protein
MWLKQSTAATMRIGPILDSTGAEYASAVIGDISITKNGTTAALAAAATLTYDTNGFYSLVLTTGNTDTLGRLKFTCNKSTYQMPPERFIVLTAKTYDALVTNSADAAGGLCDLQRILGTAPTTTTAGILDVNAKNIGNQAASLDANNLLKVDVEDIKGTAYSGAAGYFLDWSKIQNATATVDFTNSTIKGIDGVTFPSVVPTPAQIATGVWQDTTSGDFTVASSIGKSLYTSGNAPGAASGLALVGSAVSAPSGYAFLSTAQAATVPTSGTINTTTPPTVAQVAAAVWQDTTSADFTVAGSIGKSLFTSGNAPGVASGLALVGSAVSAPSGYAFLSTAQAATVPASGTINTTTPPTVAAIRSEMDANSIKLAHLTGDVALHTDATTINTNVLAIGTVPSHFTNSTFFSDGVFSTAALANAATGSGGGSGSYNVTLTVNDGTNPIQNATVTLAINSSRYTATTNSSGVAVLTPTEGSGTYTVSLTAIGYQFTPVSLVVSGNTSHTYSMTALNINSGPAGTVTVYGYTTDATGSTVVAGVRVYLKMETPPSTAGSIVSPNPITATSDSNGLFQITGCLPSTQYYILSDRSSSWQSFTTGTGSSFEVPSTIV